MPKQSDDALYANVPILGKVNLLTMRICTCTLHLLPPMLLQRFLGDLDDLTSIPPPHILCRIAPSGATGHIASQLSRQVRWVGADDGFRRWPSQT